MKNVAPWIQNPTKKQLLLFASLWVVGMMLQVAALTNFFTAPVSSKANVAVMLLLWLPATAGLVRATGNYLRRRQTMA